MNTGEGIHYEQGEAMREEQSPMLKHLIETHSFVPDAEVRPKRCRAVIFNPEGTKVLGIGRVRSGRDPYVVYPGGGLEEFDESAKAGAWRELNEELDLSTADVMLTDNVIEQDDEFFYLGSAYSEIQGLTIGGPEAESGSDSGQYLPGWYDIAELLDRNTFPVEISQLLVDAYKQLS